MPNSNSLPDGIDLTSSSWTAGIASLRTRIRQTSRKRTRLEAVVGAAVHDARKDPNRFLEYCLTDATGQAVRQAPVHRDLQNFLTVNRRALIELPRDHGKTTQVCARILWELGRNPALRVKLVCATDALAAERCRFLRQMIANNSRIQDVFSHLMPGTPWMADAFSVTRPAETIGPSVVAFGVGAGSTGARADLLVCDDVVDVRCLLNKGERDRVAESFANNLMNLLEPEGRFWGLCTPWHPDDLNARLKANPAYALFRRAIGPNLEPVWPKKWPTDRLADRLAEVGAAAFARGYRLVPIDERELMIRPEWVQVWTDELPRDAFETVVLSVDPAVTTSATADASALVVLGRIHNEVRCLEATARRLTAPDLVTAIAEADAHWSPDVILFESNAAFAGIRDLLIRQTRFGPKVRGVTQSRNKESRVAAFAVVVQNAAFRLKGTEAAEVDPGQQELFEEMATFPYSPHDDLLDAAATGTAHLLNRPDPRVWL